MHSRKLQQQNTSNELNPFKKMHFAFFFIEFSAFSFSRFIYFVNVEKTQSFY